jgi:hypothetical protein
LLLFTHGCGKWRTARPGSPANRPEIAAWKLPFNWQERNFMEKQTVGMWKVALCGLAGFALAMPALAKDIAFGAVIDVHTNVSAIRQVPAADPLPGLHIDAKINGRMMDVYIAPMDFVAKYDVKIAKGQDVHIVGTEVKGSEGNDADVFLPREITTGAVDRRTGIFHENMTIHLRNEAGPLW